MAENKGNFKYDWTDFDADFWNFVNKEIPRVGLEGLFAGANEALQDATEPEYPQAPKDEGHLWGSKKVEKIGILEATKEIKVTMGFNIVYARKWHELPETEEAKINWTTTKGAVNPGRKFLQNKLVKHGAKYMGTAVDHIRNHAMVR